MMNQNQESTEHLSPQQVAAYVDGELADEPKRRIQAHLARCDECRSEVVEVRLELDNRKPRLRHRFGGAAAVAAVAAVALFVLVPRSAEVDAPAIRGSDDEGRSPAISIVTPEPDASVGRRAVEFTWRSVGTETTYRIAVSSSDGASVFSADLTDTSLVLPDSVELEAGLAHFWYVDAILADGRSAKSRVLKFTPQGN